MRRTRVRMMPQKLDSGDDAVLAERKSTHAMIAGRTQPARTLIALNHRRILSMVATVHHLLNLSPTPYRLFWPLLSGLWPDESFWGSAPCFCAGGAGGFCSCSSIICLGKSVIDLDCPPVRSASCKPAS